MHARGSAAAAPRAAGSKPTPAPPGTPRFAQPNAGVLVRLVETNRLEVDRVVPLHRAVVPYADLAAAARQPPPRP